MTTTTHDKERAANIRKEMLRQIGNINVCCISGGRVHYSPDEPLTLVFPIRYGWRVEVEYIEGLDLYAVRRIVQRGRKRYLHGEVTGVDMLDVGETAYRASCYSDPFGN